MLLLLLLFTQTRKAFGTSASTEGSIKFFSIFSNKYASLKNVTYNKPLLIRWYFVSIKTLLSPRFSLVNHPGHTLFTYQRKVHSINILLRETDSPTNCQWQKQFCVLVWTDSMSKAVNCLAMVINSHGRSLLGSLCW